MKNLKRRVLITGAYGFLGKHLVPLFAEDTIIKPTHEECDFTNQEMTEWYINKEDPDVVIHLAAKVGGIGFNQQNPATLFYQNAIMGLNCMHASFHTKVSKFVQVGTICAYPKFTPVPFKEDDLWKGYPEDTNAPYGLAKKMLLVMAQSYRKQFGFNAIYLLPVNLYGEGDNFNPQSSHVIPAMIRKFVDAKNTKADYVEIWGTGTPTREFLYVKDCAKAIYLATERYSKSDPVNLGSSMEISIKDLALKIKELTGFQGEIVFNKDKPDGQPRRSLDTSRAEREFGFKAETNFDTGLKNTVEWFIRNYDTIKHYENVSDNSYYKRYLLE